MPQLYIAAWHTSGGAFEPAAGLSARNHPPLCSLMFPSINLRTVGGGAALGMSLSGSLCPAT